MQLNSTTFHSHFKKVNSEDRRLIGDLLSCWMPGKKGPSLAVSVEVSNEYFKHDLEAPRTVRAHQHLKRSLVSEWASRTRNVNVKSKKRSSHLKILPERFLNELHVQGPLPEQTNKTKNPIFKKIFHSIRKAQDQVHSNADTREHSGLRSTKTLACAKNNCLLSYL